MIEDPPLLVISRTWHRPDAAKVARLAGVQTSHACDAMDGRGALDAAIKPLDPARSSFVGTAITCETGPSDNLAIQAAVAMAKPGDVVISASDAFLRTAVVGDIVTMMAQNAKCAALVIDGMARDLTGIEGVGLPVFSRGITPNSCVRSGPGRVGYPIVSGGVTVRSGDVILGDRDGVVVIPQDILDRVIARIAKIQVAEETLIAEVKAGLTAFPSMRDLLQSDRVRYED